ncbi:MAG: hypothetical protein O9353_07030, partial [Bacteroidia bacterium]|nr:hypothetical protein [Bacteroidia bacterium]
MKKGLLKRAENSFRRVDGYVNVNYDVFAAQGGLTQSGRGQSPPGEHSSGFAGFGFFGLAEQGLGFFFVGADFVQV